MISVIYGSKGTGKTKKIIDMANQAIDNFKGTAVYITDNKNHIYELKHQIRYIMSKDYQIGNEDGFIGFLNGIIARDHDIEYIFIDGTSRIANTDINNMQKIFKAMESHDNINFTLTISSDYENLPDFIKKYTN